MGREARKEKKRGNVKGRFLQITLSFFLLLSHVHIYSSGQSFGWERKVMSSSLMLGFLVCVLGEAGGGDVHAMFFFFKNHTNLKGKRSKISTKSKTKKKSKLN